MLDSSQPLLGLFYLCHLILSHKNPLHWYFHFLHLMDEEIGSERLAYDAHPANKW